MNRSELIAVTAQRAEMDSEEVEEVLNTFFDLAAECLKRGESVNIRRFGKFEARHRSATVKPNPMTGDTMYIPERLGVVFIASDILRDGINS